MGNILFSCLQFSKNVNFDSSKINGLPTHISILFYFQKKTLIILLTVHKRETMITFILCALLFFVSTCPVSICSITVFALISSQYRFCPFFCEEFSHHSFPKWFPRLAGSRGANQCRHFYKFVFPSHKKT